MIELAMAGYVPTEVKLVVGIDLALFSGGIAVAEATSAAFTEETRYVLMNWPKVRKQVPKKYKFKQHFPKVVEAHDHLILRPIRHFLQKNATASNALVVLDWTPMEAMMRGRPTYTAQKAFLAGYYASSIQEFNIAVAWVGGYEVRKALGLKKASKEEVWEHFVTKHLNMQPATRKAVESSWTEHEKDAVIMAQLAMEAINAG